MPWIKYIEDEDTTGKLKDIYEETKEKRGKLSNMMKVHSWNQKIWKNIWIFMFHLCLIK